MQKLGNNIRAWNEGFKLKGGGNTEGVRVKSWVGKWGRERECRTRKSMYKNSIGKSVVALCVKFKKNLKGKCEV